MDRGLVTISTWRRFRHSYGGFMGTCGSLLAVAGGCNDDNGAAPAIESQRSFPDAGAYQILAGDYGGRQATSKVASNSGRSNIPLAGSTRLVRHRTKHRPNQTLIIHVVPDQTNDRLLTLDA
jgi:hypothetical protein